ncbi:MAG: hypothetical protein LBS11_09410 [Oscillospiraceae bacterium]|jgi:hypothetical protein|nr:hypothetical protein [Oscillospiraceae bacterium]
MAAVVLAVLATRHVVVGMVPVVAVALIPFLLAAVLAVVFRARYGRIRRGTIPQPAVRERRREMAVLAALMMI